MTIKITTNTLTLFCYTRKEFRAPPTSCIGGASMYVDCMQLTTGDRRLAVASNVGSVKQKGRSAYKPSWKARALGGMEWWQIEK